MIQFFMMLVLGIIVIFLGFLIIEKNLLSLIIGYTNLNGFRNEKSYAKVMGSLTLITGAVIIVFSIGKFLYGDVANKVLFPIGIILLALFFISDNIWRLKFIKYFRK